MDWNILIYILVSVFVVSITSLIGILTIIFKVKNLNKILLYLVSFSVGALFGDVFIHLLPEAFRDSNNGTLIGVYVLHPKGSIITMHSHT
jgi:hypothetical protein